MPQPFTPETSWFDALMACEDLFDRLVELDGTVSKFQRVLLDEEIARRLSLADVAAMLGTTAGDLAALADGVELQELAVGEKLPPDALPWPDLESATVVDTRPIFDSGHEPLPAILDAAADVTDDGLLLVIAPFHPVPLRRLLRHRGFASSARQEPDGWRVVFKRDGGRPQAV